MGANARLGEGQYLIAEADESDGSFLCLSPVMTIVTNVDADHLDFYSGQDAIDASFITFCNTIPFYGVNVVCLDDVGVRRILPRINRSVLTYGVEESKARLKGRILESGSVSRFEVTMDGAYWGEVTLNHSRQAQRAERPGRHRRGHRSRSPQGFGH